MDRTGKRGEAGPLELERYVREQNISRYRRLLGETTDETQRRTIARLLAEEVAKLGER